MRQYGLHIGDKSDIIASLALLMVALDLAGNDIAAWKSVVIATPSALQSAIACRRRGTGHNLPVVKAVRHFSGFAFFLPQAECMTAPPHTQKVLYNTAGILY